MKKIKTAKSSETIMTEVVCPNDTNPMGILQGGRLVQWMDIASAVSAQCHAERICVTTSIDSVIFRSPARVGDIITIKAKVTRAFSTSMEIEVKVWARKVLRSELHLINDAYFNFVAIDENGKPTKVPELKPVTKTEKIAFDEALIRRQKLKQNSN